MPVLNGLQATRRVRHIEQTSGRHVPIIALTAGGMPDELIACSHAGMDDVLLKPFLMAELAAMVTKWCPAVGNG